jgi:hypothetical protein
VKDPQSPLKSHFKATLMPLNWHPADQAKFLLPESNFHASSYLFVLTVVLHFLTKGEKAGHSRVAA